MFKVCYFFQTQTTKLRITSQAIRGGDELFKFGDGSGGLCIGGCAVDEPTCRSIATAAKKKVVAAVFVGRVWEDGVAVSEATVRLDLAQSWGARYRKGFL